MNRKRQSWLLGGISFIVVLALLGFGFTPRGMAEERGGHWGGHGRGEAWRGPEVQHWRHGDIRFFNERDLGWWRGGHWFHGDHVGQQGWWWIVDGAWYFYPVPVYPYPDPYIPPAVVAQGPPSPSALQYWYYCGSQNAYYPYVSDCPEGWKPVIPEPTPSP